LEKAIAETLAFSNGAAEPFWHRVHQVSLEAILNVHSITVSHSFGSLNFCTSNSGAFEKCKWATLSILHSLKFLLSFGRSHFRVYVRHETWIPLLPLDRYRISYPYFLHPISSNVQSVTVFMVVAISAERYRAICHPLSLRLKPAKYIAFVLFLSFTLELPRWFEFSLRKVIKFASL
jgi:hypothetical protein